MPCHGALESSVTCCFFFTMKRHEPNGSPCSVVNKVNPPPAPCGPAGPAGLAGLAGPADLFPGEMACLLWSSILWTPEAWDRLGGGSSKLGRKTGATQRPWWPNGTAIMVIQWRFLIYTVVFSFLSNMFRQSQMFPSNHESWWNGKRRSFSFFSSPTTNDWIFVHHFGMGSSVVPAQHIRLSTGRCAWANVRKFWRFSSLGNTADGRWKTYKKPWFQPWKYRTGPSTGPMFKGNLISFGNT